MKDKPTVKASQYSSLPSHLPAIITDTTPAMIPVTPASIACHRLQRPSTVVAMNLTAENATHATMIGQANPMRIGWNVSAQPGIIAKAALQESGSPRTLRPRLDQASPPVRRCQLAPTLAV